MRVGVGGAVQEFSSNYLQHASSKFLGNFSSRFAGLFGGMCVVGVGVGGVPCRAPAAVCILELSWKCVFPSFGWRGVLSVIEPCGG